MLSRLALLLPILILGCAAQAAPASTAPPNAAAAQPTAAPSASAAPAPTEPPSASVAAVAVSKEGPPHTKAKILFTNPSKRPCRFVSYKLVWGTTHKDIKLDAFSVPPGETRERWIRLDPTDGDLTALTPEASHVDVLVECDGG